MSEETLEPDLRRLADQLIHSTDLEPDEQDELAVTLAQRGEGVAMLWRLLDEHLRDDPDRAPDVTRAVVLGLTSATPLPRGLVARLMRMLDRAREPQVIAGTLDGLRRTHHVDAWPRLTLYLDHPAPDVRSAALRYAAGTKPTRAWGLLVSALRDSDPLVRENAVDELHELGLGVRDVLPMIEALKMDGNRRVREAAEYAAADLREELSSESRRRRSA